MQTTITFENRTKIAAVFVLAWLIPGAGHAYLRKWGRATLFFLCILSMFFIGLGLKGTLVGLEFADLFAFLKWFAEVGVGLSYLISKTMGLGAGEITAYSFDYGNIFLYGAGLLNMLVMLDAFDISLGRKE